MHPPAEKGLQGWRIGHVPPNGGLRKHKPRDLSKMREGERPTKARTALKMCPLGD